MLKVLSLFSGIGSFEKALSNLEIPHEIINYCEIDEFASKVYSLIHNVDENKNLGDITNINVSNLSNFDLLTHGSPCQDFSIIGNQKGGDEESETRSSLMWNTVEIIKIKKPKYIIWENVKNVLTKKHRHNFEKYINTLSDLGYHNFYKVLNAKDYNIPQNRERIFVVSVLDNIEYVFPNPIPLKTKIKDLLVDGYKYDTYIKEEEDKVDQKIKRGCKSEFIKHYEQIISSTKEIYDCRAKTDFQDKKVGILISPCLKANNSNIHVLNGKRIHRLIPIESWRFMGFSDVDFLKAQSTNCSNTQLYKMAGNSIVVNVLEGIFKNLFYM